jgi:hypothetical protein
MKTVSQRDFFRTPALVNSLSPGDALAVLKDGQTSFLALKPGTRPKHSTQDLIRLAESVPGPRRPFDGVALLRELR